MGHLSRIDGGRVPCDTFSVSFLLTLNCPSVFLFMMMPVMVNKGVVLGGYVCIFSNRIQSIIYSSHSYFCRSPDLSKGYDHVRHVIYLWKIGISDSRLCLSFFIVNHLLVVIQFYVV